MNTRTFLRASFLFFVLLGASSAIVVGPGCSPTPTTSSATSEAIVDEAPIANRPFVLARDHHLLTGDGGVDTNARIPEAVQALTANPLGGG